MHNRVRSLRVLLQGLDSFGRWQYLQLYFPAVSLGRLTTGYNLSAQVPNLIFGKWDELALLLWRDAVDVMFNRYSLATSNQIQVVITMLCNAIILRLGFCVSTDAASQ